MGPEYFIGVDSGTQGTKCIVMDGDAGQVLGKASAEYGLIQRLPYGHMEQHPSTWTNALLEVVSSSLKASRIDPKRVKAIGISAQQHGFVPLDSMGEVIRPAKLWNDTSTAEECRILTEALGGEDSVIRLIGNNILPGYTASKILWLKRHEPWNYGRLHRVLLPHDYLNYFLTGDLSMEYGDSSGTALMDVRCRRWSREVVEAIDPNLDAKLPILHPSDEPAGYLKTELALMLGLGDGVMVSSGGGDNMMGAIGTGNTKQGIVTVSLGTSGTIYAYSDKPVIDVKGEVAAFCDSTNGWLPLVCTMNVTVATELVRRLFRYSFNDLEAALDRTPPGSNGLIFLPYLNGERTPNVPDGTGVYLGLNSRTLNADTIVRSTVEGVTLGLNYGFARLKELGVRPREVRLTGGGTRNRAWRQIVADVFGVDVVPLKVEEAAAYGAALQAKWVYGKSIGEPVDVSKLTDRYVQLDEAGRASPKTENIAIYEKLQRIQNELSLDLRQLFTHQRELVG